MKQGLLRLLYNFGKRFMGWTLHIIMCVLLCYPLSIHMSQLLSTGRPISSLIVILLFTRQVLIARRWQEFYHNLHPSRIDCQLTRRRNLPWGQPLLLLWTLHCGGVLNAGNDCLFGKHFRRGPVKTCRGGNTCMMSSKDNRVSIPPKRFRFAL